MALQYLEAFKALGQSPATKYLIPLEFTQLADSFRGYLVGANAPGPRQTGPADPESGASPPPSGLDASPEGDVGRSEGGPARPDVAGPEAPSES